MKKKKKQKKQYGRKVKREKEAEEITTKVLAIRLTGNG